MGETRAGRLPDKGTVIQRMSINAWNIMTKNTGRHCGCPHQNGRSGILTNWTTF